MGQGVLGHEFPGRRSRGSNFYTTGRGALVAALLATTAIVGSGMAMPGEALAQTQASFNIPAGPLNRVLATFGRQSGIQLSYEASIASGKTSPGIQGAATREQAIARILQGSGLTYSFKDARNVLITQPGAQAGGALPAGAISLDTIDVQGASSSDPGRTEGTGSYTPSVTATATRLQLSPRETPQSISVVTRQQMDDFGLTSIKQVLDHTPGINTVAIDERLEFYSRGFYIQNFQYDGMPSAAASSGYPAAETLTDMAIYDRVEVLKGATGLMTGAGDPSATINLVRKKPTRTFQGYSTLSAGSWNDYRGELDLSGPLNEAGTVRGRFVTAYRDRDSYLDRYHRSSAIFYGVLEADLTSDTLLTIGADYQNEKPTGLGSSRIRLFDKNGDFNWMSRSSNPTAQWSSWKESARTIFTTLEHRFDNDWRVKLQLKNQVNGYDGLRGPAVQGYPDPIDGSGTGYWAHRFIGETTTNAADLYAAGSFELFGRKHEAVLGGTIASNKWNNEYAQADAITAIPNYYTWDGSGPQPDWSSVKYRTFNQETIRQSGIYATTRLNLHDDFKLIVGSRVANYEKLNRSIVQMKASNVIVPYVGAIYDLNENLSVYASYTDIFKPQTQQNEQGNTLDPQTGKNYEAGIKGEFLNKRLNTSAAYFIIEQDNYPIPTGGTTPRGDTAYRPVDGVRTEGFELEASGHLSPNWQLHAGFTHKISRRQGTKVATLTPENQFTLYTTYKFDGAWTGFTLGGGVRWMDKTWDTVTNPVYGSMRAIAPSYWVVDAMASYKFNDKLTATLNIRNLLDEKYYQVIGYFNSYTWGAPRSVHLSMKYTF